MRLGRWRMPGSQNLEHEPFRATATRINPAPPLEQLHKWLEPAAEPLILVRAPVGMNRGIRELPGSRVTIRDHVTVPGGQDRNNIHISLPCFNAHRALVDPLYRVAVATIQQRTADFPEHIVRMIVGGEIGYDDDVYVRALDTFRGAAGADRGAARVTSGQEAGNIPVFELSLIAQMVPDPGVPA